MEKWKKGLIVAAVLVVIAVIVYFAVFYNSGSGGNNNNPTGNTPAYGTLGSGVLQKLKDSESPWRICTKYTVAYIDTIGNGVHDGKTDYSASLHGKMSNVVAVKSDTETNPTFTIVPKENYNILVFRTKGKDETTLPENVPNPTGDYDKEGVAVITFKSGATTYQDTNNPFNGPPAVSNLQFTGNWTSKDGAKLPFRVETFYQVNLTTPDGKTSGPPSVTAKGAKSLTLNEYGPIVTISGTLGANNTINNYPIIVSSGPASGPFTVLSGVTISQQSPGIIQIVDNQNLLYTGPPALSTLTFASFTPISTTAPCNVPWGYSTSYVAALCDYASTSNMDLIGPVNVTPVTIGPSKITESCPILTFTVPSGVDMTTYFLILFRSDNSSLPSKPPSPVSKTASLMLASTSFIVDQTGLKVTDNGNPYEGVSTAVFSDPIWAATDLTKLPFKTPMTVIATLTDVNNTYIGAPGNTKSPVASISSSVPTLPVTLSNSKQQWAQYFAKPDLPTATELQLKYYTTDATNTTAFSNSDVTLSITGATLSIVVLKNPYSAIDYGQFSCTAWKSGDLCDDTCPTTCAPGTCCKGNVCVTTPVGYLRNKDGTCSEALTTQKYTVADFKKGNVCAAQKHPYNNHFLLTNIDDSSDDAAKATYDGYCASACPLNWTAGNNAGQYADFLCTALDPQTYNNGCTEGNTNQTFELNCFGKGCSTVTADAQYCSASTIGSAPPPATWNAGLKCDPLFADTTIPMDYRGRSEDNVVTNNGFVCSNYL